LIDRKAKKEKQKKEKAIKEKKAKQIETQYAIAKSMAINNAVKSLIAKVLQNSEPATKSILHGPLLN